MAQPNFEKMTRRELKAYVIENHNDEEAIQFLMKTAKSTGPSYPCPTTPEEIAQQQAILNSKIEQLKNEGDVV